MLYSSIALRDPLIKKESPNKGTETFLSVQTHIYPRTIIKKESPNKGTETPVDIMKEVFEKGR